MRPSTGKFKGELQLIWTSNKVVVTANGMEPSVSNMALLNTNTLSKDAGEVQIIPGMQQKALLSVMTLADDGYTTIFTSGQQGVAIYHTDDVSISAKAPPVPRVERQKRIVDCSDCKQPKSKSKF